MSSPEERLSVAIAELRRDLRARGVQDLREGGHVLRPCLLPPTAKVVFDSAAGHYLPPDALAVLAAWLCRRLIESAEGKEEGSR